MSSCDWFEVCRLTPELRGVREESRNGSYTLILEFNTKRGMTLEMWTDRQNKIQTFFGPGVTAEIEAVQDGRVDVALIADGRSISNLLSTRK